MYIKKRMIIISSVLTVLTLGIGGGVGVPSIFAVRTDVLRIAKDQATIDDRFAIHSIMNKTMTDIAAAEKRVAPLSDMAVQENHELEFVTAIESTAKDAAVDEKLELITANEVVLSPWEREVPVRISVVGPFKNVMTFLGALERLPYLVTVNNIQMTPLTVGNGAGSVSGNILATVYWLGATAPDFVHVQTDKPSGDATAADSVKP